MTKLYCVVYRRGGTDNYSWHRSLAMTYDEALQARLDMVKAGHHCLYPVEYDKSVSIGLPDGPYPQREYLD